MAGRIWFALALQCARCSGRGFVAPSSVPDGWPERCGCDGRRDPFTQYTLGRSIGVDPKTIVRVYELRARPSTCLRVLGALRNWLFFEGHEPSTNIVRKLTQKNGSEHAARSQ